MKGAEVVGVKNQGPKCLLQGAEVSFHVGPKCLDEGPKCFFLQKGPKCPIGAEVVGAEVVGAEVSKIQYKHIVLCMSIKIIQLNINFPG